MPDTNTSTADSSDSGAAGGVGTSYIQRNLTIKPFVKQTDNNETAVQWGKYKKDLERQFRFFGVTDPETKKDGLLIYGEDLVDIEDSLPDPQAGESDDVYTILIRKIDKHFMLKKNKDFARFQMSELKQESHERLADYYAKIREIAKKCEYGTHENDSIRDHLIRTMLNHRIRSKAIRENWSLDKILSEAALEEETEQQAKAISKKVDAALLTEKVRKISFKKPDNSSRQCLRCGTTRRHETCPAMGATCDYCGKLNHYASVCIAKSKAERFQGNRNQRRRNNSNHEATPPRNFTLQRHDKRVASKPQPKQTSRTKHVQNQHSDDSSSSDDDFYLRHLKTHHTSHQNKHRKTCTIYINDVEMQAEPDTGYDANIVDEHQFQNIQNHAPEVTVKPSKIKLKALKEDLPVIEEADVIIANQRRSVSTTIVIVKGQIDSPPLIGRATLEDLGMVMIDETGGLKSPNKIVKSISKQEPETGSAELSEILDKYKGKFTGIGKAMRDGQEIKITLPMQDDAIPIAQKPRRVPYQLVEPLQNRLQEFEDNDIIEPVPEHEAITWCSPLVQPKPKNPKDIRACLDLRVVNKSMLRTRQVQAPITEDFIREFKDCKIFSKLDLNHGYHQFALDDESRRIMTFSTPWGNYRYKRLAFGGLNSQDLFDAEIAKIISGIP